MSDNARTVTLEQTLQRLLGLGFDDLRHLPDRSLVSGIGVVARRSGPADALRVLEAARADGESLTLADERVRLLIELGRHDDAVTVARERLARKESLVARAQLARALLNAGAVDAAAEVAVAMLQDAPEKVFPLYIAGLVALARHQTVEARAHFERLLALHTDSPTGLRGLARVALAEGDAATALDLAEQALDRYAEPPPDLLRELALYAERVDDKERAAVVRRRVDEIVTIRDEAVRAHLAEEETSARRDAGQRPARTRARRDGGAGGEVDDLQEPGELRVLPAAPPPDPAMHEELLVLLHRTFGYDAFRSGQAEVVSAVIAGYDTLAVMPTGAGKSLCYQLPALLGEGVTLVISPLIALMKDQVESLPPALLPQTTLVNSTLESGELALRLSEIAAGRYRLVYAAPERLRQRPFIHALARAGVRLVVIDEAHCLSMWGHDFRPDYLFVGPVLRDLGDPRVLAMTATATPAMMSEIAAGLGRALCAVNTGVLRDNLFLMARRVDDDDHKMRILLPFLDRQQGSGIVYVNSRDGAEKLEKRLRQAGINARAYHAGMASAERAALQDRFMDGEVRVMVATVAFGMGIDKAGIRFIVHYQPPRSLESYSQESGRAGRDGKPAVCLLLHSSGDRSNLTRWSREEAVAIEELRAVYRVLRGLVPAGTAGLVDAAALHERLEREGHGGIDLRVAVSILESAELVRRGPDVPRGATVTARPDRGQTGDRWPDFARLAHLDTTGQTARPVPVDLVVLASALGIDVVALEDSLLTWQDEERLTYRPVGRDMLIEVPSPPTDAAARMAGILEGMSRRNRGRLRALFAYLDTGSCRHATIGRHFGRQEADHCRRCDICRPVTLEELQPVAAERVDDPAEAVRRLVAQFPLGYGRPGVVEVLKGVTARRVHAGRTGPLFGSLAHLSQGAIRRVVDGLLAEGQLVMEERDGYPMLRLAE